MKTLDRTVVTENIRAWRSLVRWVDRKLESVYHSPRHGNYRNPLNELIYILLSKRSNPGLYRSVYKQLASSYRSWEGLLEDSGCKLEECLRPLGMSKVRSKQILGIAKQLRHDFGKVSLGSLKRMLPAEAREYLMKLPGVGEKSARCVLMYSFGCDISPMDVHAIRIGRRVGLLASRNATEAHRVFDDRLPKGMAYRLHVNIVAHGKAICTARSPECDKCVLLSRCPYGQAQSEGQDSHRFVALSCMVETTDG